MHINNQQQLKKQKKKLSILFTLILFIVVSVLQTIFLLAKYIDYNNKEFGRLHGEGFPRVKMMANMFSGKTSIPPMPDFPGEGRGWRLKGGNMIQYNHQTNTVELSSLNDDDLTKEIINQITQKGNIREGSIMYNNIKFLFVKEAISSSSDGIFLIPSQASIAGILEDIILFIIFFGICSLGFYWIIYWFVNKLFKPIEENIQDMEQFIFNAGHELKTPLSVIKSYLQLALAKKQYKNPIDESIKEINKMNTLIESLVNLSVIQQDNKQSIDVTQEAESIMLQYSQIAKKNDITLKIKKEESCIINANKGYVDMVISNLLSNAIKYNKKKGLVEIIVRKGELIIQDTGIGIPQQDISKVYDRFFQVGNIRNQEGFGIGLSLVKKIIDVYEWKIDLVSEEGQGTAVIIHFS